MSFICGGKPWRGLFDFVICSARKPDFFFSNKQFRQWNFVTNAPSPYPVAKFEPDAVYNNGSVTALKRAGVIGNEGTAIYSKLSSSDTNHCVVAGVLYVGDNLYADLVDARRSHGWQTACVISELEHEINVQNDVEFQALHKLRSLTRQLINDVQKALENDRRDNGRVNLGQARMILHISNDVRNIYDLR